LVQDEGGDFAGRKFLAFTALGPGIAIVGLDDLVGHHAHVLLGHGIVEAAPDQALDGEEGIFGIGDALALGGLADQAFAVGAKATIEGVVRAPSAFSMTLGAEPSITATQELVVPRSMPITLAIL
jgi:hypothetical protein